MIQPQTYLTVADNPGAKKIMCIRIIGNNKLYIHVELHVCLLLYYVS